MDFMFSPKLKLSRRLFFVCLGIISLLAITHLLLQYLNLNIYNEKSGIIFELSNRLDLDDEASIQTWFSQFLLLLLSVVTFTAAYMSKVKGQKISWGIIGIVSLTFSIDEVSTMHEFVLQTIHTMTYGDSSSTASHNAWLLILPLVLTIVALVGWHFYKYLPKRILILFTVGVAVFLSGAVFVDIISNSQHINNFYNMGVLVAIEEVMELVGTAVLLFAATSHLELNYSKQISNARKSLKS